MPRGDVTGLIVRLLRFGDFIMRRRGWVSVVPGLNVIDSGNNCRRNSKKDWCFKFIRRQISEIAKINDTLIKCIRREWVFLEADERFKMFHQDYIFLF